MEEGAGQGLLLRLIQLARAEARALCAATFFLVIGSAAGLLYPQAIRLIIDGALSQDRRGLLGHGPVIIERAALAMAVLALIQGGANAARSALFALVGERIAMRLRDRLHGAILEQEVAFFDEVRTGELTTRLASDTQVLQGALSANLSMALRNAVSVVGGIALLTYTSPPLTLLMLVVVPPVAVGAVVYGRRIRRLSRDVQAALAASGEIAEETISGIRTVRAFDAERAESRRYGASVQRAYRLACRRAIAASVFTGTAVTGVYAAAAAVLWEGGRLLARGALTVGGLTSFLVYTLFVALALGALADLWAELMRALGAAERIFELLDRVPRIPAFGGTTLRHVRGQLALKGVHFAYPSRPDAAVLDNVDLTIEPGEMVAIVGPSGAGKSTLAALVVRLYDPDRGCVRLDGHNLRELDPRWLRRQVGVVWQEPILFSTTIAENIRYARPEATEAEVEAAARTAHVHEFVSHLPEGYATEVGERGIRLSGGQKQRVAIARAVLKDPRVIVMDEATSALDAESEHLVREALHRIMQDRTTLVIAHRLSTVIHADRIFVLEGGRVVQFG
ncbi:MAG TPA: ABC transporter transmembrane domain-containing protein, partial [Anaeromyxobacteraceae bacterium]|nr:ABC transporter transmembrane domain-containing protein [Anaeromyxobacteraceae bacterium]